MIGKGGLSQCASTYYLAQQQDGAAAFRQVQADVHNHCTPLLVECARSDNGVEFAGKTLRDLFDERGIQQ